MSEVVVCKETLDHPHDSRRIPNGYYERFNHRWRATLSLRCAVCGGKMVPDA